MGRNFCFLFLVLLTAGCASTAPTHVPRAPRNFPADGLITQRGVLTALGRQFTLNGYLARSASGGDRLIITENFGTVLADVLVKSNGSNYVMRSSRAFKPEWIRRYIGNDVRCICGEALESECPGQMLGPTHFVIKRRWYKLDLQTVETRPGPQSPEMFDETRAEKP